MADVTPKGNGTAWPQQPDIATAAPPPRDKPPAAAPPRKLWEHADPKSSAMWAFMQDANRRYGLAMETFHDLYAWSCSRRADFYAQLWDSQCWIHEGSFARVVDEAAPITSLPRWFDGVRLNWAENLLWTRGPGHGARSTRDKEDAKVVLTEVREGNTDARDVTWAELRASVARLASAMSKRGVVRGDRVVVIGAHSVQTLVVFLATAWLGAIFSSSSTDMGVAGLLQRTALITPKLIFFDDAALYNGKVLDLRPKMYSLIRGMNASPGFEGVVVVQRFAARPYATASMPRTERLEQFLRAAGAPLPPVVRLGFQDPLIIYYSSGTTGIPKAIVHGVGPLLMTIKKESVLHRDLGPDDVGLQYTTTGWIMYLVSVSHIMCGGRAVLYDGSPFVPAHDVLLRIAEQQRVTVLGVSPRWMTELRKRNVVPRQVADLSRLKRVTSTGMVLADQLFEWFYDVAFPKHVHLGNMSGGTDIAGSFVMENPLLPVHVGGSVGGALGMPMAVFDHDLPDGSRGAPLPDGTPGDLVSTAAFPSVPLFLWGDSSPAPGDQYTAAYFARFDGAWAQGDFCVVDAATRGVRILGRSDGVLNPSGVRFGSADIYAVMERRFAAEVAESLCVGQRRAEDADERVVLFVVMRPGHGLDGRLAARIRAAIADETSKRHVPKYVFEAPEIPVTVNGKKVELPVKRIISGVAVKPSSTLLNPKSLDYFYRFQRIEALAGGGAKL